MPEPIVIVVFAGFVIGALYFLYYGIMKLMLKLRPPKRLYKDEPPPSLTD